MGGGAMRTAAKAAVLGGYRSAESAMARRTPRSSIVPASSGDSGMPVALVSGETGRAEKPLSMHRHEFDDWEFTGVEEEELFDAIHPAPRIVFGGVPTLQEAKEATSDLKDAIEMIYFSPRGTNQSVKNIQGSTTSENSVVVPEVPKHVVNAFSLLQGNPEAQNVVASLASDKNVWDAIMNNDKVMAFYKNQESAVLSPERSIVEEGGPEESVESSTTPNNQNSNSSPLWDWVNNIKLGVSGMMTNISYLLQDFMGASAGESSSKTSPGTVTGDSIAVGVGASFLALAVAAILVVLFKRGA